MDEWVYEYFPEGANRDIAEEHRRRILYQVDIRWRLRDMLDPFGISVTEFSNVYRLPQHLVMELIGIISPYMPLRTQEERLPLELRVLVALGFYAQGSYQRPLGRIAELSMSQASVSNCVTEVTDALNHPEVMSRFIKFPLTRAEREETIGRNDHLGLPRVLGYVDGTLVKIVPPPHNEHKEAYYCRKGFTALNVQIVCDADLNIFDVNVQYPGSCNDPFIYRYSGLRQEMERAYRETRCWLLGDSGYGHELWLRLPLPHASEGTREYVYTRLHCHCRNVVERCIGVLKARWRCLHGDRALHYRPAKAGRIVNACAILHNFCRERNVLDPPVFPGQFDYDDGPSFEEEIDAVEELDMRLIALADLELQYLIDHANEVYRRRHLRQWSVLVYVIKMFLKSWKMK